MIKLKFVCEKDKILEDHYAKQFGGQFAKDAQLMGADTDIQRYWTEVMMAWARLQEHYDFTTDDRGIRTPVKKDGEYQLLVPTIGVQYL